MPPLRPIVVRDDHSTNPTGIKLTPTTVNLTIALFVLVLVASSLALGLYLIRLRRRRIANNDVDDDASSMYDEKLSKSSKGRSLTVRAAPYLGRRQSTHVYEEKRMLIENSCSPPSSPDLIPEIRITFPEEEDESGRRKSGRVVIVRVGETGLGLEPLTNDSTQAHRKNSADSFHSIDLEHIGGLKERRG